MPVTNPFSGGGGSSVNPFTGVINERQPLVEAYNTAALAYGKNPTPENLAKARTEEAKLKQFDDARQQQYTFTDPLDRYAREPNRNWNSDAIVAAIKSHNMMVDYGLIGGQKYDVPDNKAVTGKSFAKIIPNYAASTAKTFTNPWNTVDNEAMVTFGRNYMRPVDPSASLADKGSLAQPISQVTQPTPAVDPVAAKQLESFKTWKDFFEGQGNMPGAQPTVAAPNAATPQVSPPAVTSATPVTPRSATPTANNTLAKVTDPSTWLGTITGQGRGMGNVANPVSGTSAFSWLSGRKNSVKNPLDPTSQYTAPTDSMSWMYNYNK